MRLSDFDYDLPGALIAQFPPANRSESRLLHLDSRSGISHDRDFRDLPDLLSPGEVLVFNDTRVIKARLFGHKSSGGRIEALIERVLGEHEALAFIRASHKPRLGALLTLGDTEAEVLARHDDLHHLRFAGQESVLDLLERAGSLPLPPYIARPAEQLDKARYQTVYAREPGAVAAPTAGLHFDQAMMKRLDELGVIRAHVTLHVGAGTFRPVRFENIARHRMHSERYSIPGSTVEAVAQARRQGKRVMAVGTTSLRALESAATNSGKLEPGEGETDLFITPGYEFQIADRLLTNFHLPRSTLLMLVSAFGGTENIRRAYKHAIAGSYRFFSYGDAMLIEGQAAGKRHAV
ncbi:MAG TPA: tRNA preQ1(34) S-adenosylmethionine ribosyltransferase-isomerase QueA [Thiobacillaceae bacterium]|nr:tRNA preQ1(34) S-adenosylmethionine ribosyltransferase-isomerase QueA [Thiobacillaceae bacterium]